jgi:hypothetical protein
MGEGREGKRWEEREGRERGKEGEERGHTGTSNNRIRIIS